MQSLPLLYGFIQETEQNVEKHFSKNRQTYKGLPRGTRDPAFTQVFSTNHAQKLPEIHVHAKFT